MMFDLTYHIMQLIVNRQTHQRDHRLPCLPRAATGNSVDRSLPPSHGACRAQIIPSETSRGHYEADIQQTIYSDLYVHFSNADVKINQAFFMAVVESAFLYTYSLHPFVQEPKPR